MSKAGRTPSRSTLIGRFTLASSPARAAKFVQSYARRSWNTSEATASGWNGLKTPVSGRKQLARNLVTKHQAFEPSMCRMSGAFRLRDNETGKNQARGGNV